MSSDLLYQLNEHPFGLSWEKWAELWCNWLLTIPKRRNPAVDISGRHCKVNQKYENVWFLTGTFGNDLTIKRKCKIPAGRAIFLPVLFKEDSFAESTEDDDVKTEDQLKIRNQKALDEVVYMSASVDDIIIENLVSYRVQSDVFDLNFPKHNVYYNKKNKQYTALPGLTRSVCCGFWLFIKPLKSGKHYINFDGETKIIKKVRPFLINNPIYYLHRENIRTKNTFKLDVSYEVTVCDSKSKSASF